MLEETRGLVLRKICWVLSRNSWRNPKTKEITKGIFKGIPGEIADENHRLAPKRISWEIAEKNYRKIPGWITIRNSGRSPWKFI